MGDYKKSYKELMSLEFKNEKDALHKNKGEDGLTFMGIYEKAYPDWSGWDIIKIYLKDDLKRASVEAFRDTNLKEMVFDFYKKE